MNSTLYKTRRSRQWTQYELAHRAATTQATVSRLETGIYRGSRKTQLRIAGALGLPIAAIFPPRYPDA
ncbi:MAG: helix-turn-helix transcriptional regulator [Thermoleophilaceae bacterium]